MDRIRLGLELGSELELWLELGLGLGLELVLGLELELELELELGLELGLGLCHYRIIRVRVTPQAAYVSASSFSCPSAPGLLAQVKLPRHVYVPNFIPA